MVLALFGLIVSLFTPRLIVSLPVLGTIACAVISLFRRERIWVLSLLVLGGAVGLLMLSGSTLSRLPGSDARALRAVEVVNWNWMPDPSFAGKGIVHWNAQIRNVSQKYVESVRLELTTYDASGQLVTTAINFVNAIPPGEVRSGEAYADYYGRETRAAVQVTSVQFSSP